MKDATLTLDQEMATQNEEVKKTVQKERGRLFDFIRKRVPETEDAEDILQDVFYELVENTRLMKPVEQLASWLFAVARNKIADLYRKPKTESLQKTIAEDEGEMLDLEDMLPANDESAEAKMMRSVIMDALEEALDELPATQREVFVMHELEDKSFAEIAAETGIAVNTLLSRKRYAVIYLRKRLQHLYNEIINS